MKFRWLAFLLLAVAFFPSCEKNTVSKIPHISLIRFGPDVIQVNLDTAFIEFSLTDGDADIGNDNTSQIYLKDTRYESAGFIPTPFPEIDGTIEDPKKGLQGVCLFIPVPQPAPRTDSLHMAVGDTMSYEIFIKDRAGNESNHIITNQIIITL